MNSALLVERRRHRWHYNGAGRPKLAYPRSNAIARAEEMNEEDRVHLVSAYCCKQCGAWHVGRLGWRQKPEADMFAELGDRVAWNLTAENVGTTARRRNIVVRRLMTAAKRRQAQR